METAIKEIATVLHSTETMADQFAQRVQERVGQPVSYAEILATMEKMSAKTLTIAKVTKKVKQEQRKEKETIALSCEQCNKGQSTLAWTPMLAAPFSILRPRERRHRNGRHQGGDAKSINVGCRGDCRCGP